MDQRGFSSELQALLELQDTQKEIASTMMAQIIEVQVLLRTMIDLQKLTLTSTQPPDSLELDSRCQSQTEKYRRQCLEELKRGVSIAKSLLEDHKGSVM